MNFSTAHNVIDNRIQRNPGNSLGFIILDFKSNQKRKLIKHTSEARINKIDQDFINRNKTQIHTRSFTRMERISSAHGLFVFGYFITCYYLYTNHIVWRIHYQRY